MMITTAYPFIIGHNIVNERLCFDYAANNGDIIVLLQFTVTKKQPQNIAAGFYITR